MPHGKGKGIGKGKGKGVGKGVGKGKGKGMVRRRPCCDRFYELRNFFIQSRNQGFSQIEIILNGITSPTQVQAGQILPIELGQATGESVFVDSLDWFEEQNCRILLDAGFGQFAVADRFIDCQTLTSTFSSVQMGPGRL